jgi:hypothetical protein
MSWDSRPETPNAKGQPGPVVFNPNAKILELLHSIGMWSRLLSGLLVVTGLVCVLLGILTSVGMQSQGVADTHLAAIIAVGAGFIQLVLSRGCRGYALALEKYLYSGNQLRLVEIFSRQRNFCLFFGLMTFSLLGLFCVAFIAAFSGII